MQTERISRFYAFLIAAFLLVFGIFLSRWDYLNQFAYFQHAYLLLTPICFYLCQALNISRLIRFKSKQEFTFLLLSITVYLIVANEFMPEKFVGKIIPALLGLGLLSLFVRLSKKQS